MNGNESSSKDKAVVGGVIETANIALTPVMVWLMYRLKKLTGWCRIVFFLP